MQSIYIKYLNKVNKPNKKRNEIRTCALGLEQELYISNKERKQAVSLLQQQTVKVKRYEKMIDALQSSAFAKPNKLLPSIKSPIDQCGSTFTHALSLLVNNQSQSKSKRLTRNTHTRSDDGSFGSGKLTKALLDPPIFTDGKDPSIDQWLSKMQGKFEINWDYYPTDQSKLIYAENRVGRKALQHLEPCLCVNSITPFATIEDLFNHLEDIFGNPHRKEHAMEKFRELKMEASSFSDFYSEFIRLASDLEYTSEMLIREFKHKLTPRLQDRLNSGVELPTLISALAKRCLSIYKPMQATDRIRDRTKHLRSTQTSAPTYSSTKTYQVPVTNSRANTSFFRFSSSIMKTVMPTPQHLEEKQTCLIKEGRCFSCKKRGHTAYDCPKKRKIAAISEGVSEDSNSQGKE